MSKQAIEPCHGGPETAGGPADAPVIIEAAGQDGGGIRPLPPRGSAEAIMRLIEGGEGISLSRDVSYQDIRIADGMYALYKGGYETVTPEMIAMAIDGGSGADLSPQRLDAIRESVDRMRRTFIRISFEREAKRRKKKACVTVESYLIPADRMDVKAEGCAPATGYKMLELPVLYGYAEDAGLIGPAPAVPMIPAGSVPEPLDSRPSSDFDWEDGPLPSIIV